MTDSDPSTTNPAPASLNPILPADIILLISSHLPLDSLVNLSHASRFYRSLLLHSILTGIRHLFVAENTFHHLPEPYGWRAKLGRGKSVAVHQGINTMPPELVWCGPTTNIVYARLVAGVLLVSAYQPGRMGWNVRALFGDGTPPAEEEGGKGKGGLFGMKFLYDYLRVGRIRKGLWLDYFPGDKTEFERREKEMMEALMEVAKDGEVGDVLDMALDEDLLEWIVFAGNRNAMQVLIETGEVDSRNMTERYDRYMPCLMIQAIQKAMKPVERGKWSHESRIARRRFAKLLVENFPDALETCVEGNLAVFDAGEQPIPNPYHQEALLARRFKHSISRQELTPFPEKVRNVPEITLKIASHLDLLSLQDFAQTSKSWRALLTPLLLRRWGQELNDQIMKEVLTIGSAGFRLWSCYLLFFLVQTGFEEGMMKRDVKHVLDGRECHAMDILKEVAYLQAWANDEHDHPLPKLHTEYLRLLADDENIRIRTEELMKELVIISSEGRVDFFATAIATKGLGQIGLFPLANTIFFFNKSYVKVLVDCGKFKDEWLTTEIVEPNGGTRRRWFHLVLTRNMPPFNLEPGVFFMHEDSRRKNRTGLEFIEALIKICPAALHSAFEYKLETGEPILLDAPGLVCRIGSLYVESVTDGESHAYDPYDPEDGLSPQGGKIGEHMKDLLELFHANGANFDLALQYLLAWPSINSTMHLGHLSFKRRKLWELGIVELLLKLGGNPNSIRSRLSPEAPRLLTTPLHPHFEHSEGFNESHYFNLFLDHGYDGIDILNHAGDSPLLHLVKLVLLPSDRGRGKRQSLLYTTIKTLLKKRPECVHLGQWRDVVERVTAADESSYSVYQGVSVAELKRIVGSLEEKRKAEVGAVEVVVDG